MRGCCSKTISLSTRHRGPSQETPPELPRLKNTKAIRAAAVITDSEHEPLPPYFDTTWNGPRTAKRHASKNVASRADSVCVDSSTSSSFLPKDAETVRLDHFLIAFRWFRFLRHHWRGCGSSRDVHVDKRHVLHKLLHRGLGKSGNTAHTPNIPRDRGLRVHRYERLWRAVMVPFSKARELPEGSDPNLKS